MQSPNWWRTARDALAAAWALLGDALEPAANAAIGRPNDEGTGDQAWRVAGAIRWAVEAAVALRLPYSALQPAEAWAAGWRGVCRDTARDGGGEGIAVSCRMVLQSAGARCRSEGCSPVELVGALDHAGRALAVCYTERRSHH
ncbi:MAG TPA: hypothetical protein VF116_17830 [Ktedonobacterales bacterium]